jgi:carnitine 3-dehydrogenase
MSKKKITDPDERHIDLVAVIGNGLTGTSWAGLFAAHGCTVRMFDHDPGRRKIAFDKARSLALFLKEHGLADPDQADQGIASLYISDTLAEAVHDVGFVQESVFESYDVKRDVFKEIDRFAPKETIIATSSSGLSISRIQTAARYPQRCVAGHPYNPPHLIPLVEVAPGEKTSTETVASAKKFYESVGKTPVTLSRDIPGYLANRMSAALWREAINLVIDGVASVEDVDKAISMGPGLRWAVMGPHLLYHLGGGEGGIRYHVDHLKETKETMWRDFNDWTKLPQETADQLAQGLPPLDSIRELAGERDEKLARIIQDLATYRKSSK